MSYDLMVFEPSAAPRERTAFLAWYEEQTAWSEPHGYNDPVVSSPALQDWCTAITAQFPNLNGPDVTDEMVDDDRLTDYSIGTNVIYAAFRWTQAEAAYPIVRALARQHQVGFYDVSGDEGDGEIMFPGDLERPPSGGAWREIATQFRDLAAKN